MLCAGKQLAASFPQAKMAQLKFEICYKIGSEILRALGAPSQTVHVHLGFQGQKSVSYLRCFCPPGTKRPQDASQLACTYVMRVLQKSKHRRLQVQFLTPATAHRFCHQVAGHISKAPNSDPRHSDQTFPIRSQIEIRIPGIQGAINTYK